MSTGVGGEFCILPNASSVGRQRGSSLSLVTWRRFGSRCCKGVVPPAAHFQRAGAPANLRYCRWSGGRMGWFSAKKPEYRLLQERSSNRSIVIWFRDRAKTRDQDFINEILQAELKRLPNIFVIAMSTGGAF